jgi:hypothetical protein
MSHSKKLTQAASNLPPRLVVFTAVDAETAADRVNRFVDETGAQIVSYKPHWINSTRVEFIIFYKPGRPADDESAGA